MSEEIPHTQPSRDFNPVNYQLKSTVHDIKRYVKTLKAKPDDFAYQSFDKLKESIVKAQTALLRYEFKEEHSPLEFDATFEALDDAITFLITKYEKEEEMSEDVESHEKLANETIEATNLIRNLVVSLEDLKRTIPIKAVDLSDQSYETGKKVEEATGKQLKKRKRGDHE